jgi:hypothetical protein
MTPSLDRRIEAAIDGLVFSSESDRPFRLFRLPAARLADAGAGWPMAARRFAGIIGADPAEPAEEQSLDSFLARHIEYVEPADAEAWARLPRYDALKRLLLQELKDVRVLRIGRVAVRCFVVGLDRRGDLVGVETVAVET